MAPMSLLITVGGAVVFNVANGFVNGTAAALTDEKRLFEWQFWIGVIVFLAGMSINVSADYHLFSLRQQKADGDKPKQRYFIPRKGMFVYVSAANYFGEILEWAGYAIASGNIAGAMFLFFTMANLIPRGLSQHRWYRKTFGDAYPRSRKAIIPFLL
ncbi:Steroid 5-alpha-reductase det2 [Rhizoclosmatium sp. JEL0117]|nr:Steroid 5-alpha-reductase det2 [Rhizoclosmatium sp. JEL0117]